MSLSLPGLLWSYCRPLLYTLHVCSSFNLSNHLSYFMVFMMRLSEGSLYYCPFNWAVPISLVVRKIKLCAPFVIFVVLRAVVFTTGTQRHREILILLSELAFWTGLSISASLSLSGELIIAKIWAFKIEVDLAGKGTTVYIVIIMSPFRESMFVIEFVGKDRPIRRQV